ncbi:hypothetical protein QQP08_000273 [Theobroma cacao]|nr:hypothetical protein QQP08_000273 [Theobroma cacao]
MTWAYALCELAGDWGQGDRIMVRRSLGCIRSYSFEVGPKWGPTITIFWGLLLVTVFKATRCLIGLRAARKILRKRIGENGGLEATPSDWPFGRSGILLFLCLFPRTLPPSLCVVCSALAGLLDSNSS